MSRDQAHLSARERFTKAGVGMLKFGDLTLQAIDFPKQGVHVFAVSRLDRSDTTTASPVAQAAAI